MEKRRSVVENMVEKAFGGIYKGKRVLVTGHTGFKGSWLSFWLNMLGANVTGYSLYIPSKPSNFKALKLEDKIIDIKGDIRDIKALESVFRKVKPDIVFHLAAQPIVRKSYDEPKVTFDTNLGGTINFLECVRKISAIKAAVIITSDKCYENVSWEYGYRETDRLGGEDPYSASKACAEIAAKAYIKSYFSGSKTAKIATVRAGNVIGGGDWATDRIVPDCIKAWSLGRKVLLRRPKATRPWQHVLEPVSGYLWLGSRLLKNQKNISGEAFNFGPNTDAIYTVKCLVGKMARKWNGARWYSAKKSSNEKKECSLLKLCCDKALVKLGWKAVLDIDETVKEMISWYKSFYNRDNMANITASQIEKYLQKAAARGSKWTK